MEKLGQKKIEEWLEGAARWVALDEYDFSDCESMQGCIAEAMEILKAFLVEE